MEEELKAYLPIGCARKMDIRVILDDIDVLYEGEVEEAPSDIKRMIYSKMKSEDKMVFYVYSKFNNYNDRDKEM